MRKRTRRARLDLLTLVVAIVTFVVAFFVPEIRHYFGLDNHSPTVSAPLDLATPTFTPTPTDTPTATPHTLEPSAPTLVPTVRSNRRLAPDVRVLVE